MRISTCLAHYITRLFFNVRVDFDIGGINNSLLRTVTEQEEVDHPWLDNGDVWETKVIQQRIVKSYIESEDEALLKWPANFQGHYALVNRDQTNAWGSVRGYAIHPGSSPVHNVRSITLCFVTSSAYSLGFRLLSGPKDC